MPSKTFDAVAACRANGSKARAHRSVLLAS
jgi:hypothetical protein